MENRFKVPKDRHQISKGEILQNMGNAVEQEKSDKNIKANEIKLYIEKKRKERNEKKKLYILNKLKFAKEKEKRLAELQKQCKIIVNASNTKREKTTNTFTPEKSSEYKTEIPQTNSDEKSENLELWDMEKRITSLQKQLEARKIEFLGILEEREKLRLKRFKEKEQELLKHIKLYDKLIEKSKKSLIFEIEEKDLQIQCFRYSNVQYTTKYNFNNVLEKLIENLSPSDKTIWAEEKKYFCQIKPEELNTIEIKDSNDTDNTQTEMKNIHLKYQLSNDYSLSLIEETDFNNDAVDTNVISSDNFSVLNFKMSHNYTNRGEQELCLKNKPDSEKLSNTSSPSSNIQSELLVDLNDNNHKICEENEIEVNPLDVSNNEIKIDNQQELCLKNKPDSEKLSNTSSSSSNIQSELLIDLNDNNHKICEENRIEVNPLDVSNNEIKIDNQQELCLKNKPDSEKLSNTSSSSSNIQSELLIDLNDNNYKICEENGIEVNPLEVSNNEIKIDNQQELCLKNKPDSEISNMNSSSNYIQNELLVDLNDNNHKICGENRNDVNPLDVLNNEIKIDNQQELCLKNKPNSEKLSNTSSSSSNIQSELLIDLNKNNHKICEENGYGVNPLYVSNNEIKIDNIYRFDVISDENVLQYERSSAFNKLHDLIKNHIKNRLSNEDEMSEDIKPKNNTTIDRHSNDGDVVYNEMKSSGEVYLLINSID